MPNPTFAKPEVLAFYRALPFNFHESPRKAARAIRKRDPLQAYPSLVGVLGPGVRLLDVGSGAGWLGNAAAAFHGCDVTGIDFNSVAVERAIAVREALRVTARFEVGDLFTWGADAPFDVVTSIGVLHHTDDCLAGLARVARDLVKPGGHLFVGLYHAHGRRPFLDHFAQLRAAGADEDALLARYRALHPLKDETHLRSWFRDQVLHPHETQHTLAEALSVIEPLGFELLSTSINDFEPLPDRGALFALEPGLAARGEAALLEDRYYPGFFLFLARKAES